MAIEQQNKRHLGISTPASGSPLTAPTGSWLAAVVIPSGTMAVRLTPSTAVYIEVDTTTGDPAAYGASLPPGSCHQVDCLGCTRLHLSGVTAQSVVGVSFVQAGVTGS